MVASWGARGVEGKPNKFERHSTLGAPFGMTSPSTHTDLLRSVSGVIVEARRATQEDPVKLPQEVGWPALKTYILGQHEKEEQP
jgi:hypothetical protein